MSRNVYMNDLTYRKLWAAGAIVFCTDITGSSSGASGGGGTLQLLAGAAINSRTGLRQLLRGGHASL